MKNRLALLLTLLALLLGFFLGSKLMRGTRGDAATSRPASTETHLTPCSPHLGEFVIHAEYLDRVRRTLRLGLADDPASLPTVQLLARTVATPGWRDPEWVVSIYHTKDGETTVELVEAETSIWGANYGGEGGRLLKRHPVPVSAHRFTAGLSADLAQQIGAVWIAALLDVRPRKNRMPVLDATTYTFIRDTLDHGELCGESTAGIGAEQLLEIATLLRRYVKASEKEKAGILRRIHELAI